MLFLEMRIYATDAESARILPVLREFLPYVPVTQVDACKEATVTVSTLPSFDPRTEYFEVEIEETGVCVRANDLRGFVNAAATLAQWLEYREGAFYLPVRKLSDAPVAGFRSFMADPARNKIPLEEMRTLILSMAKARMNVLHLHLSDSVGFAFPSDAYPDLPPAPGGAYTKDELREIIDYAGLFGIDVLPELDVPAHSFSTVAWKPHLRCQVPGREVSGWNLCLGNEEGYQIIDTLLGEIAELFPYEYIHIGTDELDMRDIDVTPPPISHTEECECCRAFFEPMGLHTIRERFYWFVRRIYARVTGLGKKMMMWNDDIDISVSPDLPRDILIEFWRVAAEGRGPVAGCSMKRFVEEGFEVVNAYFEDTYIDEFTTFDRLLGWDYRRDPYSDFTASAQVRGGETCAWEGSNYSHYLYALYFALPLFGAKLWRREPIEDKTQARLLLSRAVLGCDTPKEFDLFAYTKGVLLGDARYLEDDIFPAEADLEQMRRVLRSLWHQSRDERLITKRLIAMSETR